VLFVDVVVANAVMLQLQVDRAAVGVTVRLIVVAAVTVELSEGQQTDSGCAPFVFATDTGTVAHNNATTTTNIRHNGGITATADSIYDYGTRVGRRGTVLQAVNGCHVGFRFHVHFELDGAVRGRAG